jgi:HK97 family phage portal protein
MILKTPSGEHRVVSLDTLAAMEIQAGGGRLTAGIGTAVDGKAVAGLPAANLAIRTAATAVAKRRLKVWRGEGIEKKTVTTTWQARFFGSQPNERDSWFLLLEATEGSLSARNNAYWVKAKDGAGRVTSVYVKHPDSAEAKWDPAAQTPIYRFVNEGGHGYSDWMGPDQVLHFRVGYAYPSAIVAPTPVQLHRESFSASVAKIRHEANYYRDGLLKGVAVVFPKEVSPDQARLFREALNQEHGGVDNGSKVRVFGGGAAVQDIGLTLADAEFIASKHWSAREIGQIFAVPATLLDVGEPAQKPLTPEHEEDRWNRHWLEPRLARIQETIRADQDFFGVGASFYPAFADTVVRADVAGETTRLHSLVQDGILTPDEARAELGYPPHPGGLGAIPQITPVGGAPNPDLGFVDPYADPAAA